MGSHSLESRPQISRRTPQRFPPHIRPWVSSCPSPVTNVQGQMSSSQFFSGSGAPELSTIYSANAKIQTSGWVRHVLWLSTPLPSSAVHLNDTQGLWALCSSYLLLWSFLRDISLPRHDSCVCDFLLHAETKERIFVCLFVIPKKVLTSGLCLLLQHLHISWWKNKSLCPKLPSCSSQALEVSLCSGSTSHGSLQVWQMLHSGISWAGERGLSRTVRWVKHCWDPCHPDL